jgi:hypothetical protein
MTKDNSQDTQPPADTAAATDDDVSASDRGKNFGSMKTAQKTILLQKQELEIAALKAKLNARAPKIEIIAPTKISKMTDEQRRWYRNICDQNKKFNWGKVKFCTSESKLTQLTGNIFDGWNLKEFRDLPEDTLQEAKAKWIAENRECVRSAMNEVRNYSQSQLRACIVDRMLKGEMVPTPDQVQLCALRDPSIKDDESMQEVFDLYHDELLFKVVGKEHWDGYIRHYQTICGAGDKISVGTEGYLVALHENCYVKWQCIAEQKQNNIVDKKREDPRHKTKYITSEAGQARWGGWTKEGRVAVSNLNKLINTARKSVDAKEIEEACLARVRAAHDVQDDEASSGKKKKRKRKVVEEEEEDDEFDKL